MPFSIPPFRSEWWKICQPRINLSRVVEKSSAAFDGRATLKNIVDSLKNPEKHSRNACRTLVQDLQNTRLVWKRTLAENWWNVGRNVEIVSNRNIENQKILRKKVNSIRVSMEFKRIVATRCSRNRLRESF